MCLKILLIVVLCNQQGGRQMNFKKGIIIALLLTIGAGLSLNQNNKQVAVEHEDMIINQYFVITDC